MTRLAASASDRSVGERQTPATVASIRNSIWAPSLHQYDDSAANAARSRAVRYREADRESGRRLLPG